MSGNRRRQQQAANDEPSTIKMTPPENPPLSEAEKAEIDDLTNLSMEAWQASDLAQRIASGELSADGIEAALEIKQLFDELEVDPIVVAFIAIGLREWIELPGAKTEIRRALNYGGELLAEKVCLFFMEAATARFATDRQRQIGRLLAIRMEAIRAHARVNRAGIELEQRRPSQLSAKSETAGRVMLRMADAEPREIAVARERVAELLERLAGPRRAAA